VVILVSKNEIRIFRKRSINIKLLREADVVAKIISKYISENFFIEKNYVGYLGKHYTIVGYTDKKDLLPFALGFVRKLANDLEEALYSRKSPAKTLVKELLQASAGRKLVLH